MADFNDWPSRKLWGEIKESIRTSNMAQDKNKNFDEQIKLEAEFRFADKIAQWLGTRIRLNGISDNLVNIINDETSKYCQHLSRYHTISQRNAKGTQSFKWNKGRRFSYLILDVIGVGQKVLATSMIKSEYRSKDWGKNITSGLDGNLKELYESQPKTKRIHLNAASWFKVPFHKRLLTRWFLDQKVFDNDIDQQINSEEIFSERTKLTPVDYLQLWHDKISGQKCEQYLAIRAAEAEVRDLEKKNSTQTREDPSIFTEQNELITQSKNRLNELKLIKAEKDMMRIKTRFTQMFSPWLVEAVNSLWFDVMEVEKANHSPKRPLAAPRRQPISNYENYTMCLVIYYWFENASQASNTLEFYPEIKTKFQKSFPKSICHYSTAKKEVEKVNRQMKKASKKNLTIFLSKLKQELIELCEKKNLDTSGTKLQLAERLWADDLKEKTAPLQPNEGVEEENQISIKCEDCDSKLELDKHQHEQSYVLTCTKCGLVDEVSESSFVDYVKKFNSKFYGPLTHNFFQKNRISDWETKIIQTKDRMINNSNISESTKTHIKNEITKQISRIKRYKHHI